MATNMWPQVHELSIHKTNPLKLGFKLGFYVEVDHIYSPQCGYHVDILVYNCPNEQQSLGGLKFATQISPLLNFIIFYVLSLKQPWPQCCEQ